MDKKRRKTMEECIAKLNDVLFDVKFALDEEEMCRDNTPENFQNTDAYYKREDVIDELSDAEDYISDAIDHLKKAIGQEKTPS